MKDTVFDSNAASTAGAAHLQQCRNALLQNVTAVNNAANGTGGNLGRGGAFWLEGSSATQVVGSSFTGGFLPPSPIARLVFLSAALCLLSPSLEAMRMG